MYVLILCFPDKTCTFDIVSMVRHGVKYFSKCLITFQVLSVIEIWVQVPTDWVVLNISTLYEYLSVVLKYKYKHSVNIPNSRAKEVWPFVRTVYECFFDTVCAHVFYFDSKLV